MVFGFDWWSGDEFRRRKDEAKTRCARARFPNVDPAAAADDPEYRKFHEALEVRTIVYLRDGFSYEVKNLVETMGTWALTFECIPADDAYKVGCFIVTLPFDDVVRVEIFAVHPEEKPEDLPSIKGFAGVKPGSPGRPDERHRRDHPADRDDG